MGESAARRLSDSTWWRASKYEVVGESHIAPAPDAEIEVYDPFEDHQEYWGGRRRKGVDPPYISLLNIDTTEPEQVVEWCETHGLLGILPHRTLEVALWPRWTEEIGQGRFVPIQAQYHQGAGLREAQEFEPRKHIVVDGDDWEGIPLDPEDVEAAISSDIDIGQALRIERPEVRVMDAWGGSTRHLGITAGYARFFPRKEGVPDWEKRQNWGGWFPTEKKPDSSLGPQEEERLRQSLDRREYPFPFSKTFLREYGEPLSLFHHYSVYLHSTWNVWRKAQGAPSVEELHERLAFRGDRDEILPPSQVAGLRPAHPHAKLVEDEDDPRGYRWERRWQIPSLYSAFHVMILQDYTLHDSFGRYCEKCGNLFTTDLESQKYCDDSCRNAAEQARRRARRKAEGKRPS